MYFWGPYAVDFAINQADMNLLDPGWGNTNGAISNGTTALSNTQTFGLINAANQPRILQLSLKINF